jgi:23S rRNA pseudouridine1911/1915/1917 synthase
VIPSNPEGVHDGNAIVDQDTDIDDLIVPQPVFPPSASPLPQSLQQPASRLVSLQVGEEDAHQRIDIFITMKCDGYSRVFLRKVLSEGHVRLDGKPVKPSFKVQPGQQVEIDLPPLPSDGPIPEDIPLSILFEDEHLVAIDKPAGMVVHPAKGHWSGTLTSALAHHFQQLSDCGGPTRPGIVHRLDRETSGVIIIAKTNMVHYKLANLFEARELEKEYWAICLGVMDLDRDRIVQPIGHHPFQRDKMAIRSGHPSSRDAETRYEVLERFGGCSLLKVQPKTGRTHQIRVHLAHVGHPILCDRLYAGHTRLSRGELLRRQVRGEPRNPGDEAIVLERQALHARRIAFQHPITGQALQIEAPIPSDFQSVLELLRSSLQ